MPTQRSALKRIRSDKKKHLRNISAKSELKTLTKNFNEMIESGKLEEAKSFLNKLASRFDKAATKGIIHKSTSNRKKSRLTLQLKKALGSQSNKK